MERAHSARYCAQVNLETGVVGDGMGAAPRDARWLAVAWNDEGRASTWEDARKARSVAELLDLVLPNSVQVMVATRCLLAIGGAPDLHLRWPDALAVHQESMAGGGGVGVGDPWSRWRCELLAHAPAARCAPSAVGGLEAAA